MKKENPATMTKINKDFLELYLKNNSIGQALQNPSCRLGIDFRAARSVLRQHIFPFAVCLLSSL